MRQTGFVLPACAVYYGVFPLTVGQGIFIPMWTFSGDLRSHIEGIWTIVFHDCHFLQYTYTTDSTWCHRFSLANDSPSYVGSGVEIFVPNVSRKGGVVAFAFMPK